MKRNIVLLVLLICMLPVIGGCSKQVQADKNNQVVLRFAYASNSQPVIDSMKKFGAIVEERTHGQVKIEYFPDGQLGGETELIELTQTGGIDFTKVSGSALEVFSKDYSIFGIPYLFDDEQHFYKVMENRKIMNEIYQSTNELGFVGLTYYDSGQRSFYMKNAPIKTLEDLKGKKIRVMQSETAIKMVQLLGASPVPMGSGEDYTSLQANLIDGAENNEFVLYTAGHGSIAKYYSYDEHTRVPDIVIMNNKVKDRLTKKQYQIVLQAAKESTEYEKKVFKKAVEQEKKIAIKKYDVQFNQVDVTKFREAVQPLHDTFKNNPQYHALYEEIRALSQNK